MAGEYASWTVSKLKKEREKIDRAIEGKEREERESTLREIQNVARKNGFELSDLLGEKPAPKRRGRGATSRPASKPKYRNPEDPQRTWSGRGRKPNWILSYVESGGNVEDLAI